jgi:hypothetical protein
LATAKARFEFLASFLTTLGVGELMYRTGRDEYYLAVARGFAEVRGDKVIVLADNRRAPGRNRSGPCRASPRPG